jgi:hypothetical protein
LNENLQSAGKLVPLLREGVAVVKMVLFKEIKSFLAQEHGDTDAKRILELSGDIINEVFEAPPADESPATMDDKKGHIVDEEVNLIKVRFPNLMIPLTDALRVQFLCDSLEGVDSEVILSRAKDRGILRVDREIPFPKNFMNMTRKLGVAYGLLLQQDIEEE